MIDNGKRLGNLLMDADIITKRQLAEACAKQGQGDKRKLGEILVEMGYVNVADLTEVMMAQASKATDEVEKSKRDRLLQKQISKSKSKQTPAIQEKIVAQPIDISEDVVMKTKFALDIKTMISAAVGIATLVGFWYALQADIQEAKELPSLDSWYEAEYPSKPSGYNWPRSYEQYKSQVGTLQDDMDDVLERLDDAEDLIQELRIVIARKRDK